MFENAEPVSNYDFSEQGLHKWNNKYYAEVVSCGGAVQNMPADPKRASEIFLGWINNTTGDYADDDYMHVPALSGSDDYLIFEAKWEELDLPLYAVRFFDKEGSQIGSVQNIAEGNDAVPPVAPEVSGYVFVGWDKPYTCITADVDINALYGKEDTYWTVTYYDENGTAKLHEEQVFDNTAAVGFTPTKAGMQFYYWADKTTDSPADLQHVTKDMEVRAVFADALHTVAFRVEGVTVKTIQVAHGADFQSVKPTPDPTRPATEAKIFAFDHWTPELTVINEDITFDAVFTESARTYTVRFQNWNHDLIETQQVEYGKAATAPADPTREGYIFTGWDHEFDNILADMTVTAQYKKNKGTDEPQTPTYKVTIITPEHGAIQVKESYDLDAVPENTVLHLTAVPDSGYEFKQWNDGKTDNPLEVTITKDIAFSADFEKIPDSLDEINVETSLAPVKTLINGNLFIITPDGRMFNATGAEVR